MKRLTLIFLFCLAIFAALVFRVNSNPSLDLPACFLQGRNGQVQDLSQLCGEKGVLRNAAPTSNPPVKSSQPAANLYTAGKNSPVVLPKEWKVYPDGSISPSPGILVPTLYDIN